MSSTPHHHKRLRRLQSQLLGNSVALAFNPSDSASSGFSVAAVASAAVAPTEQQLPSGNTLDWRTQGLIAAGLDLAAVRESFLRDGYCIVKNVVGEDERLNVAYELAELVEREAEKIGRAGQFADEPFETRLLRLFEDRLDDAPEIFRENTHLPGAHFQHSIAATSLLSSVFFWGVPIA